MDHGPLVKFVDAFEKSASEAGLTKTAVEELFSDKAFQQSCLKAALQLYASGTKNVIVLSSTDTAETLLWRADLDNPSCKYDLPSQHADGIKKYDVTDLPFGDSQLEIHWLLEHYKEALTLNGTALLAFLTHAGEDKDLGRDVPVVLLSEFYNGRDEYYTYAIEPHEILGRALVRITTAKEAVDYSSVGFTTGTVPANMPDPCKVFAVLEP